MPELALSPYAGPCIYHFYHVEFSPTLPWVPDPGFTRHLGAQANSYCSLGLWLRIEKSRGPCISEYYSSSDLVQLICTGIVRTVIYEQPLTPCHYATC